MAHCHVVLCVVRQSLLSLSVVSFLHITVSIVITVSSPVVHDVGLTRGKHVVVAAEVGSRGYPYISRCYTHAVQSVLGL